MSTFGIIADIHGNLTALLQALDYIMAQGVEAIVCLGDIVGYNPEGNECVSVLERLEVKAIAGNHDLIALGLMGFERCSDRPQFALRRTRKDLSHNSRLYLSKLSRVPIHQGPMVLMHGGFEDINLYVVNEQQVRQEYEKMQRRYPGARIGFFGHTHQQRLYEVHGDRVIRQPIGQKIALRPERGYLINPGSIDASRKSVKQSEFALLDTQQNLISFFELPYNDSLVERKAREQGYRMSPSDERLYQALGWLRRGKRLALRTLRTFAFRGREAPPC